MATLKQIEANRRNAEKSTGPKTPQGKAVSSRNALYHGIFARDVVLVPEEDPAEFQAVLDEFNDEFHPETANQRTLVFKLARSLWHSLRLERIRNAVFSYHAERSTDELWGHHPAPKDPADRRAVVTRILGHAWMRDDATDRHFQRLQRADTDLDRAYHRAIRRLFEIAAEKNSKNEPNFFDSAA